MTWNEMQLSWKWSFENMWFERARGRGREWSKYMGAVNTEAVGRFCYRREVEEKDFLLGQFPRADRAWVLC